MFKNYLKIAFRNIKKHKGYSFINIVGLTIGIVCFILISLFVLDELSYDRYHEKADQIYRVCVHAIVQGQELYFPTCCAPMAQALVNEFPDVLAATRLRKFGDPVLRYKKKVFSEERWFWADPTVFDVFTIPFIQGNPKTALTDPNTVVITISMAKKYFGQEDPMGKTINADNRRDYLITGIIEDVPENSHYHYDFLASFENLGFSRDINWISNNFHTYFVLQEGVSPNEFEEELQTLIQKYIGPQLKQALGVTAEEFFASGGEFEYFLQPLTSIHLHSHMANEHEPNGNIAYVYIFSIIAIAILLIACINFVNLATARSAIRSKEVGVRKVVGSNRSQLTRQFLAEAIFLSLLAFLLALPVIKIILPFFNNFTGKNLSISYLGNIETIAIFFGIPLLVGILAGIYPAFLLSSFKPIMILKGSGISKTKSPWIRNILVVFQFTMSVILIIGTLVVYRQLNFIQNRNLGFNPEQIIIIHKADDIGKQIWSFKQKLLSYPGVSSVTNISNLMGDSFGDDLYTPADRHDDQRQVIFRMWADRDLVKTYQMELAEGRYFTEEILKERREVVLNQTAIKFLGIKNPVGQKLLDQDRREYTIVGVLKDFHFESLNNPIKPMIIHPFGPNIGSGRYLSVRVSTENIQKILSSLEESWHNFAESQAFDYEFFDEHFAKIYLAEKETEQIFFVFSLLAIVIACLGLSGLASFVIEQRTKQIAIHKVLGASVPRILSMLSMDFIKSILLANIVAWPIAYFLMNKWLQNFAYRISIELWIFIFAGMLALAIALMTVSYQSIKAAIANPIDSLRYE